MLPSDSDDASWMIPTRPLEARQPPPGTHRLRLTSLRRRPSAWGLKLAWGFQYTERPDASLTILTSPSLDARSNATGLLTALNGGDFPGGKDMRSFEGRELVAQTTPKAGGRYMQFAAVRPTTNSTFVHIWRGKAPRPSAAKETN